MTLNFLLQELEERFKPVKVTFSPWPFTETSIKGIRRRETTQTGQVNYIVDFKDGQTKQVNQLTMHPLFLSPNHVSIRSLQKV